MSEFLVSQEASSASTLDVSDGFQIVPPPTKASKNRPAWSFGKKSDGSFPAQKLPSLPASNKQLSKLTIQSATEFLGMFMFMFLSLGGVQSALFTSESALSTDPTLAYVVIAMCFGFGLALSIFFAYRISGGSLNPAVSFGLLVAGVMDPITFIAYTVAQLLGAMAGCGTVAGIFPGNNFRGANQVFAPTSLAQGFFLELILTFGLVLTVLFLAVEKSKITFYAPMAIGVYGEGIWIFGRRIEGISISAAVFVAHLIAIPFTNTSINPARSFGASVAAGVWKDHWVFWVAPLLGGGVAGCVHRAYKALEYETLNPGQDADRRE